MPPATRQRWLAAHPRFHVHFIPTSSSWLNMVERWFGELTTKLLQRGVHTNVQTLEADIRNWIATWNDDPRPYVWTKTADEILDSITALCQRIKGGGHYLMIVKANRADLYTRCAELVARADTDGISRDTSTSRGHGRTEE